MSGPAPELRPAPASTDTIKVPKTVLLADRSLTIQRVVELTFATEDVNVIAVSDGDRAIEVIGRSRPDVVLADVGMPRGNGYELADYMRRQPRLAAVPILLLHGAFEAVDHAKVQAVGADGVLTKPFDPAVLIGRVNELLAFGRSGHAVERGDAEAGQSSTAAPVGLAADAARQAAADSRGDALRAVSD